MKRRLLGAGVVVLTVLVATGVITAFSGHIVKTYLTRNSGQLKVERISFGWGTIEGHGVKFIDKGQEVAAAKRVAIMPSLFTFFRRGYSLSKILVEEPTVTLTIGENGRLAVPFSSDAREEEQPEPKPLRVGLLKISNGILALSDRRPGNPAQVQVHNLEMSIGPFSYPFSDALSTVNLSGLLSGKALSGRAIFEGSIRTKSGAFRLSCTAQDLKAVHAGSQKPHMGIEKLSFKAESQGSGPIAVTDVQIDRPSYRYYVEQENAMTQPKPRQGLQRLAREGHPAPPFASVQGITVTNGEVVIVDSSGPKAQDPVTVVGLSLSVDRLALPFDSTPSLFSLSGRIPGQQNTADLRWSGKVSLANLDTDSQFTLKSLDLVTIKPYLEQQGEASIAGGTLEIGAHVRIHNRFLDTPVAATIRSLKLAPAKDLGDKFMGVPRSIVLNTLKTRNDEIRMDFVVSGSLDNPSFSLREGFTKRFTFVLARNIGLSPVVGAGETVIEQGARALKGAGKGIQSLGRGVKGLFDK